MHQLAEKNFSLSFLAMPSAVYAWFSERRNATYDRQTRENGVKLRSFKFIHGRRSFRVFSSHTGYTILEVDSFKELDNINRRRKHKIRLQNLHRLSQ
jgi:hypothetical protein